MNSVLLHILGTTADVDIVPFVRIPGMSVVQLCVVMVSWKILS